jgi:hypothetical protein
MSSVNLVIIPISRLVSQHTASHIDEHFACIVVTSTSSGSLENELSIFSYAYFLNGLLHGGVGDVQSVYMAITSQCRPNIGNHQYSVS